MEVKTGGLVITPGLSSAAAGGCIRRPWPPDVLAGCLVSHPENQVPKAIFTVISTSFRLPIDNRTESRLKDLRRSIRTVAINFEGWGLRMARHARLHLFPVSIPTLALVLVICSCAVLATSPSHASAAGSGPVAAYSFDEGEGTTVEDVTGDGHTATIEGATWTTQGKYGGAMEFDAAEHDRLVVPDSPEFDLTEEFTLEAWVRPEGENYWAPIIAKEIGGGEGEYALAMWLYGGDWESNVPSGGTETEAGEEADAQSEEALPEHVWSHLALTWDGSRLRLYVDGHLIDSKAGVPPEVTEGNLVIGGGTEYASYFDGRIDEVRIYDRALDGGEVESDMEAPIETPKQGPVAAWSFDEGEGTTVEDVTGDGHTATIEGAEWTEHGRYGSGMKFDGEETTRLEVPYSPEFALDEEFTMEAWVRPESSSNEWAGVVAQEGDGESPVHELTWYLFEGGWNSNEPFGGTEPVPGEETVVAAQHTLPVDAWSHIAITWDGSWGRFYLDGELVNEGPIDPPPASEGGLRIGEHFDGRIDELRIYDRALDGAEVGSDMEAPIETPKQGPVAAWSFDEGEGTTVEDVTGDGHEATIEGATWTTHGRYGGGMEFDASEHDRLVVPSSPELDLSEEFTLEAWVRPQGENYWAPIVAKETGREDDELAWWLYEGDWESNVPSGGTESEPGHESDAQSEVALPQDAWSHVALTWDGSRLRLYVDGELIDSKAGVPPEVTEGDLVIGGGSEYEGWFDGRIDELRIYDRALDGAEVGSDMEAPIETPKQGPVAAWSFDEGEGTTVEDVTGDGHTATIEGAEWTEHGRYGGAMRFDGEGAVLSVPDSPELDLTEQFTLEAWVRPESEYNEWAPILAKQFGGGESHWELAWWLYEAGWEFNKPWGGTEPEDEEREGVHAEEPLAVDAWSHVAVTWDGAELRLYVDGELVASAPEGPPPVTEGDLDIGGATEHGTYFKGRIDEVRIYDRALTGAEVDADMEDPIQTPKAGPVAAWSFDEGEGTTAEDLTGDGHIGTIEGAEWVRGRYGDALKFDGAGDVVKIPNSPEFDLTEAFTLEAWVRPESESNEWAPILAKEMGGGEAAHELAWWLYEGDWESNKPYGGTEPAPGEEDEAHAPDPLPVDAWSHVALTYDGAKVRLYIDGKLVDCSPVPAGPPPVTEGELQIGAATEHGDHFVGRIDEVRVYDRALNATEVVLSMAALPEPATGESYEVGETEAILTGVVNPMGLETEVVYEWGPTEAYGEIYPSSPSEAEEWVTGNEPVEVEQAIDELEPETTYHYRVVARNALATVAGPDRTFTTGARELEPAIAAGDFAGKVGINWSGYYGTRNFEFVAESGARMFRAVVAPPFGEKAQREATQKKNDNLFRFMANHHIMVLPDVSGIPGMAATAGNHLPSISPGTQARARWIAGLESLVNRYGPEGTFWKSSELDEQYAPVYWEIWNEENEEKNADYETNEIDPARYGTLLEISHEVIESANNGLTTKMKVLFGGLLDGPREQKKPPKSHLSIQKFITETHHSDDYAAMSIHPYAFKGSPQQVARKVKKNIQLARGALNRVGGTSKKLWISEIGFPVQGETEPDSVHRAVGENAQRERLEATLNKIKSISGTRKEEFNIANIFWYNIQDWSNREWAAHCGLVRVNGTKRSSFKAFQNEAE
ncbi:MAG: LamG domain-containing protein [Solirubrobacterales bacterium]